MAIKITPEDRHFIKQYLFHAVLLIVALWFLGIYGFMVTPLFFMFKSLNNL